MIVVVLDEFITYLLTCDIFTFTISLSLSIIPSLFNSLFINTSLILSCPFCTVVSSSYCPSFLLSFLNLVDFQYLSHYFSLIQSFLPLIFLDLFSVLYALVYLNKYRVYLYYDYWNSVALFFLLFLYMLLL